VSMPWYIMTSPQTDTETKSFFSEHKNFGLPSGEVQFFMQGNLPCLTAGSGKIIMEAKHRVSSAPNGNGGVYRGLRDSGCLADMNKRGVKYAHFYGVDNALVKIADPLFVGFCVRENADCANKVVLKRSWNEKVGVMCHRDGRPAVVEYSEVTEDTAKSVDKSGRLLYSAANIVNHFFTVDFLARVADHPTALPFHVASKKIPCIDEKGNPFQPTKENGIKMEMFVFDSFALSLSMVAFAVTREHEFTAVKNANGAGVLDSPATALADLSAVARHWLTVAGANIVEAKQLSAAAASSSAAVDAKSSTPAAAAAGASRSVVELSSLVSLEGEDLEVVKGKTIAAPIYLDAAAVAAL